MKHSDYFKNFLDNTVNLSKFNLDVLSERVDAIYGVLEDDEELGPRIKKKIPQGSWAQRTIISPQNGKAFDGDFMVQMVEEPDWSHDLKKTAMRSTRCCTTSGPTGTCLTVGSVGASTSTTRTTRCM